MEDKPLPVRAPSRGFLSIMLRLAIPIAAQQLFFSSVGLVEVWMLGQLGEMPVAAVSLGKQVYFLLSLVLFGLTSGSAIFAAQYWGKGDLKGIHRVLGICLALGLPISLAFALLAIVFPHAVLGIYSGDQAVVDLGSQYLVIMGPSYLATAIVATYSAVLRSTENVRLPMVISILTMSLNTLLNYLLILGPLGLPALGARGAAIATCFSRCLECAVLLAVVYRRRTPAAARPRTLVSFSLAFLRPFLRTTLPVVLTEALWSLGVTTYSLVYARMGTEQLAAVSICTTIEQWAFFPFSGLAHACAIMVGNRIGAGQGDLAFTYARRFLLITVSGALLVGAGILLVRDPVLSLYNVSSTTHQYSRVVLAVLALFLWAKMVNMVMLVGVLRSGGDTGVGLLVDAGPVWMVGVPMAALGAFLVQLPVYVVVALVMADELTKMSLTLHRVFSRRWIHNVAQTT